MQIKLKYIPPVLAVGAAAFAVAVAGGSTAAADTAPATVTVTPPTVTVTSAAAAPGPQDGQSCTTAASSTLCQKQGDAEINAAIPAPYPGPLTGYGPFFVAG
jgi:hypothetical protein